MPSLACYCRAVPRRFGLVLLAGAIAGSAVLVGGIRPAAAVSVSTESELRAAFATETAVDVEADIVLSDCTSGGRVVRPATETDPVTIDGHGHTILQTCSDNVLDQEGPGLVTLRNVTITGAHASGNGGGIFAAGPVTLTGATIVKNRADGQGGGIAAEGVITLVNSTIDSNVSSGVGGGIALGPNSHVLTLTDSTVSNNVGGGIGTQGTDAEASVTIVNSTIANNTNGPGSLGGGIFSAGSTTLIYATVVGNTAGAFGNIDTVTLDSFGSVVAKGAVNCLATTTSHGYNFSDDGSCKFTDSTDRENAGDPQLGPLADTGGGTQTLVPQPGSALIDAIPPGSCQADGAAGIATDQRGITRPQGPGCDIGAVEVEVPTPPTAPVSPAPPTRPARPVSVTVTPRFTG